MTQAVLPSDGKGAAPAKLTERGLAIYPSRTSRKGLLRTLTCVAGTTREIVCKVSEVDMQSRNLFSYRLAVLPKH